jgi:tRNA pseudouridine38-40 synthase
VSVFGIFLNVNSMIRIKVLIAYDGTSFCGWQIQPGVPTIQLKLQEVLKHVCGKQVDVVGAGRTDTGVHAYGQVAHFDWDHALPLDRLQYAMNGLLPPAIRILSIEESVPEFHARFDAKSKSYLYRIDQNRFYNPFSFLYSLHCPYALDLEIMQQCLKLIEGEHDFAAFQATGSDVVTSTRTMLHAEIFHSPFLPYSDQFFLCIRFHANGFLRKMVRFLVGTILEIGSGKRSIEELTRALETRDRRFTGIPAAARGLFLEKVYY